MAHSKNVFEMTQIYLYSDFIYNLYSKCLIYKIYLKWLKYIFTKILYIGIFKMAHKKYILNDSIILFLRYYKKYIFKMAH